MKISYKESISAAFSQFKKSIPTLLIYVLLPTLLILFIEISTKLVSKPIMSDRNPSSILLFVLVRILTLVIEGIIWTGVIKIYLKILRDGSPNLNDFTTAAKIYPRALLGSILFGAYVSLGYLILLIPGIIWNVKYGYVVNLIIDKNMKVSDAFDASATMTDKIKGKLFTLNILFALTTFAGFLLLIVGSLISIPVVTLAQYYIYDKLLARLAPSQNYTPIQKS